MTGPLMWTTEGNEREDSDFPGVNQMCWESAVPVPA